MDLNNGIANGSLLDWVQAVRSQSNLGRNTISSNRLGQTPSGDLVQQLQSNAGSIFGNS